MPDPQDLDLLRELEPVVEKYMNRHLSVHKAWNPHDYIPWSDGKNFYALGGQDWEPGQSKLTDVAQVAMVQNLMTEDNLPSYHREIAMSFGMDGAWGQWVNRWTAEENRHGIALRDYLVVTRAVDPIELEKLRLEVVNRGFSPGQNQQGDLLRREPFRLGRVRHVPGTGHPRLTPQHRQGLQRDHRRSAAGQDLAGREPAHDLLPRCHRSRPRDRSEQGDARAAPGAAQLQDARILGAGVPPQGSDDRRRRRLRPAHSPRRGRDAGAEEVAHLRARRLLRTGCARARRPCRADQGARGGVRQVRGVQAAPARAGSPQGRPAAHRPAAAQHRGQAHA